MQTIGSEIVRVANVHPPQHAGETANGHATWNGMHLEPGYYLALLPRRGRSTMRCDARVHYFGPFKSRVEAQLLAVSALAFGLLDADTADCPAVLPRPAHRPIPSNALRASL